MKNGKKLWNSNFKYSEGIKKLFQQGARHFFKVLEKEKDKIVEQTKEKEAMLNSMLEKQIADR